MTTTANIVHLHSVSPDQAIQEGFGKFNGGPHLCVDVPDDHFTISARTSTGEIITFAFVPYTNGGPAGCVDVEHQSKDNLSHDKPNAQTIIAFGQGPTLFRCSRKDKTPVTLTTFILQPEAHE